MFKQIIALMQANKIATFVCAGALVTTATVGGGSGNYLNQGQ